MLFPGVSLVQSDQLVEAGLFHVQLLHGGHSGDFLVLPSLVDCNPVVWEIEFWPSQVFASGLGSGNPFLLAFAYSAVFTIGQALINCKPLILNGTTGINAFF